MNGEPMWHRQMPPQGYYKNGPEGYYGRPGGGGAMPQMHDDGRPSPLTNMDGSSWEVGEFESEEAAQKPKKKKKNLLNLSSGGGNQNSSKSSSGSSHAPSSSSKRGGRMKNSSTDDPIEKPFHCELCGTRYKSRTGLTYHYTHYHRGNMNDYRNPATAVNMINLPTDGVLSTGGGGGGGNGGGRGSGNGGSGASGPGSGGLDEDSSSNSSLMMGNPPGNSSHFSSLPSASPSQPAVSQPTSSSSSSSSFAGVAASDVPPQLPPGEHNGNLNYEAMITTLTAPPSASWKSNSFPPTPKNKKSAELRHASDSPSQ